MSDELEEIRRKKLAALQEQKIQQQLEEHEKIQQQVQAVEEAAKQFLDRAALQRFGALKSAHPEKALQAAVLIVQAAQKGQLTQKISDEMLKQILLQLTPPKKEFKLTRK